MDKKEMRCLKDDQAYKKWYQDNPRFNEEEAWPAAMFPEAGYHYFRECGCLICSLAVMLRHHNIETETCEDKFNPWILNQNLIRCGAFSPGADLYMDVISELYPIEHCAPVPFTREKLVRLVEEGYICLLTVRGSTSPVHFIVLDQLLDDDALVFDPKKRSRLLSDYDQVFSIRVFQRLKKDEESSTISKPRLALTFDDGPSEEATGRILTALESVGAKATFFVHGGKVADHACHIMRMAADGHQIGSHTWDHRLINHLDKEDLRLSIQNTADVIDQVCGVRPTILRPPGGSYNSGSLQVLKEMGLPAILWNIDPRDWATKDVQETVEHVLKHVKNRRIVLMHDVYEETAAAVEILLPELAARGFEFVTIDELAGGEGNLRPGEVYTYIGYDFI